MKYEFIKIENTRDGMMAFMLDHERGVVVIAPVEYLGEEKKEVEERPRRRVVQYEDDIDEPRAPARRREVDQEVIEEDAPARRPAPKGEMLHDGLKDVGHSKPSRVQNIIPPHLRGLMKKDADIERRETLG